MLGLIPTRAHAQGSAEAVVGAQQKKLILVVGVAPNPERRRMTKELMTSVVNSAVRKTNKTNQKFKFDGKVGVETISPIFYSEFSKLVNQTEGKSIPSLDGEGEGILVSPVNEASKEFPHVFRLTLKEPKKYLFSLEVGYEDKTQDVFSAADKAIEQVTRAGVDSQDRAQYWVRLKQFPEKFKITAKEPNKPDSVYSGQWPRTRSHFAVTFNNYQEGFEALRDAMLDKTIDPISEPVDNIAEFADTRFLLASIGFTFAPADGPTVTPNNQITITIIAPRPGIDSIWVKLPYQGKELDAELADWNALSDGESVIKKLRGEPRDEMMGDTPTDLSSTTAPKWYRLKKDPKSPAQSPSFSRAFKLTDQPVFAQKYSPLSLGMIHQTDEGDDAVASLIGKDWVKAEMRTEKDDADLAVPKADGAKATTEPATEKKAPQPPATKAEPK